MECAATNRNTFKEAVLSHQQPSLQIIPQHIPSPARDMNDPVDPPESSLTMLPETIDSLFLNYHSLRRLLVNIQLKL
jgi:hypothetical protein